MSDVVTIGSTQAKGKTEEQKKEEIQKAAQAEAERIIRKSVNTQFVQVLAEVKKGKNLDDILKDIEEKESPLTRSAREFMLSFKKERIQEWIDETLKK